MDIPPPAKPHRYTVTRAAPGAAAATPIGRAFRAAPSTRVRDGYGDQGVAHAIVVSLPTPVRPQQHLILTADPEPYPPGIVTVGIDDPRLEP
ncbi:hypothetical protein ACIQI7_13330 [Kitasatospora sp. NPDC092039]|uniref:hypothetical protein n=1 Tax=Kitasatospora sp. NPDC092039 TaxID=3364086 RepID=UPI003812B99B